MMMLSTVWTNGTKLHRPLFFCSRVWPTHCLFTVPTSLLFSTGESPTDTPVKTGKDSLALELEPLVAKPSPEPVHLDIPRPKRDVPQESDTDSDYSPPATIKKPSKGTTFAEGKKMGHHKQLSLYSWLSSPPTTSPPTTTQSKATSAGLETKTGELLTNGEKYLLFKFKYEDEI